MLYRITEHQVLASAGLDAFVVSEDHFLLLFTTCADRHQFLSFFKMSIKFLSVAFLIAAAIIAPINSHFGTLPGLWGDDGNNGTESHLPWDFATTTSADIFLMAEKKQRKPLQELGFLWAYTVFTYVFSALALYFMITETQRVINIRQDYLGSQSTITDRTIRLSGIPKGLRSEKEIKEFLEKLEIGKVDSVTICRDWKELDDLMDKRASLLRKLEESYAVHLGTKPTKTNQSLPTVQPQSHGSNVDEDGNDDGDENEHLLGRENNHISNYEGPRPTTRIWHGFMRLQSRKVDAIDYYEEKLRRLDEQIKVARKKEYKPMPLAFVTMDSIPACQMAVQALLDPSPMVLLARPAPAPSDVIWRNTYLSRSSRILRSWVITVLIVLLTVFWLIPVGSLAGLLSLCSIQKVWPELAEVLSKNEIGRSLVQTGLPTLIVSLLNVAVPYLYYYLSMHQGSTSEGDVELAVIGKNFFFTFFNFFLVFTIFGTASKFWPILKASLQDTTKIAFYLAQSLQDLGMFYVNFIILQGIGLFPFRLLEFGSVSLYPIYLMGAKTPRDYAELVQPPIFSYAFYLPTALLVWILCIVYSVLPAGYMVLFFGLLYFTFGYLVYKYQLLYAMDHPSHSTGRAWPMICHRMLLGLGIFQLAMVGVVALKQAFEAAVVIVPLLPFTIWFSYFYARTYEPLLEHIALRSIRRENDSDVNIADEDVSGLRPAGHLRRQSRTIDEDREKGQKFVNPSLYLP